jgi:hypothetical protein
MNAHVIEVLYRHFSGFGYGIMSWNKLSDEAKAGWRRDAEQIFKDIARGDVPAVEVFYRKYSGKGNPPYNFKDANNGLQNKWRGYVERFFLDLVDEGMPQKAN